MSRGMLYIEEPPSKIQPARRAADTLASLARTWRSGSLLAGECAVVWRNGGEEGATDGAPRSATEASVDSAGSCAKLLQSPHKTQPHVSLYKLASQTDVCYKVTP